MSFKTTFRLKAFSIHLIACFVAVLANSQLMAQSPTSPALGFNVFLKNGATLITNESEGPVALGGDITLQGDYRVANNNSGTFYATKGTPIGLLIGGKVNYVSGNGITVNQGAYVSIGDCSGSYTWYTDNNNANSNIQITNGKNYNATPRINIQTNAKNLGVSEKVNPVCQSGLINFEEAFAKMQETSKKISGCTNNANFKDVNEKNDYATVSEVLKANGGKKVKLYIKDGINIINVTGDELNAIADGIIFIGNKPDDSHVVVFNVNATGTYTWNVGNQAGIGGSHCAYILYNFYNTSTLNLEGNNSVEGTIFAPFADIVKKVNQSNIEGQIIALSYYQSGGENHYYNFTPSVTGCGCTLPTVAAIAGTASVCKNAAISLTNSTAGGTWTSSNASVATINSSGVVTALTAGKTTITYSVTNSCGTNSVTQEITVNEIPTNPTVGATQPTCLVSTGTITVTAPIGIGTTYSMDGTTYTNTTGIFAAVAAGTYNVTAKNASGCVSGATSVTINNKPQTPVSPTVSAIQPTCLVSTGTITVTAPIGIGLTYSIDGTTYTNTTGIFAAVDAGTYNITAKNASGCVSGATSVTINNKLETPVNPTVSPIQPTCLVSTGTIRVNAPIGIGTTYSIDGTTYTNTTGIFAAVAAGTYNVTAKNASGCVSGATSVTINNKLETPVSPTVSAIQPTCLVSTGTITVTAPIGIGLTYSIDGTTYTNTTGIFAAVAAGTYNVTAKNPSGCVSGATSVTINNKLETPVSPTVSAIQPTCLVSTGTISVNAPIGIGMTYSMDGTTYTNTTGIFAAVAAGTYNITAKNASGCVSGATSVTINNKLETPATPVVNIVQPTCSVITGAITVNSPTGIGITYSTDGTTYTNTSGNFTALAPGSYSVSAKNASGCISENKLVTINTKPEAPATPTVTTVQPSCLAGGTITITAPIGIGMSYSIDATTYSNTSGIFSSVPIGTYSVTAKNASGCISTTKAVVLSSPDAPAKPTATAVQPTCAVATGSITINSPTDIGMTYSIDGITYTNTTGIFTSLITSIYTITAKNVGGCISATTSVTINTPPAAPSAAISYTGSPYCVTGTATATQTGVQGGTYSASPAGLTISASTGSIDLAASTEGNYTVTYTYGTIPCISTATTIIEITSCSVTSGNTGGVESKSLGDAITKRVVNKAMTNQNGPINYAARKIASNKLETFNVQHTNFSVNDDTKLSDIMPGAIAGYADSLSSPEDLVNITNAKTVLSVDYLRNQFIKAVAFATKTNNDVYSHTKPICDRLKGAQLLNVAQITVSGYRFIRYTIKRENGDIEYATSFSIGTQAGRNSYTLQSNWLTKDYTGDDIMYNYQLWAVSPSLVNTMLQDVIAKLQAKATILVPVSTTNGIVPKAYVISGSRNLGTLTLTINNNTTNNNGYLEIHEKPNEFAATTTRIVPFNIAPNNGKATINLQMNDSYESDIWMYMNNQVQDLVYMGDGAWSINYNSNQTSVQQFTTSNNNTRTYGEEYPLFRDVHVKATTSNYVTISKLLHGGGVAQNVSAFKTLKFTANGGNNLRITLIKEGIKDWNNQYTILVPLDNNTKDYYILLDKLVSASNSTPINATDVTSVVFNIEVSNSNSIDATISNISFTKEVDLSSKDVTIYPNPSTANRPVHYSFVSDANRKLTLRLIELTTGREILQQQVNAVKGNNNLTLNLGNKAIGNSVYVLSIEGVDTRYNRKTIVVYK